MRDPKLLLLEQAKKNPTLQLLLDNLNNQTIEEIKNITGQPKWVVDALVRIKNDRHYKEFEAYVLDNCIDNVNQDFIGKVYKWISTETYVKFGNTDLLVKENDLLFITDKGIWIDTAFTKVSDDINKNILFIKECKFTEYKLLVKDNINARYGIVNKEDKPLYTTKKYIGEYPPENN